MRDVILNKTLLALEKKHKNLIEKITKEMYKSAERGWFDVYYCWREDNLLDINEIQKYFKNLGFYITKNYNTKEMIISWEHKVPVRKSVVSNNNSYYVQDANNDGAIIGSVIGGAAGGGAGAVAGAFLGSLFD